MKQSISATSIKPSSKIARTSLLAMCLVALVSGCATSSPDVYRRSDAQSMAVVAEATVISVRRVVIEGSKSGAGAVAGGIVGGVAGSSVGGRRESVAIGVLGAVAGAVAGSAIERHATREEAVEVVVRLRNGERRAIVQAAGGEYFSAGQRVDLIASGGKTRVVAAR